MKSAAVPVSADRPSVLTVVVGAVVSSVNTKALPTLVLPATSTMRPTSSFGPSLPNAAWRMAKSTCRLLRSACVSTRASTPLMPVYT